MSLMTVDEAIQRIYGIDDDTMARWQRERAIKQLHRALWRLKIKRHLEALTVEYAAALYLSEGLKLSP